MSITSNNIFQANCVIISGLLVLFAIQSFGPTPIGEVVQDFSTIKILHNDLNKTLNADAENVSKYLKSLSEHPNDLGYKFAYDESVRKLDYDTNKMSDLTSKELELDAKLGYVNSIPSNMYPFAFPKLLVSYLLIPFVASSIISITEAKICRKESAGWISIIFFSVGVVLLAFGLILSQQAVTNFKSLL